MEVSRNATKMKHQKTHKESSFDYKQHFVPSNMYRVSVRHENYCFILYVYFEFKFNLSVSYAISIIFKCIFCGNFEVFLAFWLFLYKHFHIEISLEPRPVLRKTTRYSKENLLSKQKNGKSIVVYLCRQMNSQYIKMNLLFTIDKYQNEQFYSSFIIIIIMACFRRMKCHIPIILGRFSIP